MTRYYHAGGRRIATRSDEWLTGQASYAADFGLLFYQARWYDPYITHFTSPDSIIPDNYNTLDFDRYQYVRSNPLKYTDPTGHDPWGCSTSACEQNLLHRDGKGKIELAGSFYVGNDRARNLTENEAEVYSDGSGGVAGAVSDVVSLADNMTNIAKDAAPDNSNVFVYTTHDDNSDGSVNLTGVTVYNESKYSVFLASVTISSQINFFYELRTSTCTVSQCYSPNPPSIKGGPNSGYFATIPVNQSKEIPFVPSGEPSNMTNRFGSESLSASATLFFVYQAYPGYTPFNFKIK